MLNIVLIIFLLVMAWWWSSQGLFSGFIHLILTIFSGAIALAVWEPLVNGFLIDRMPEYAWGCGLLAPFAIVLLLMRWASDSLVPGNINFPPLVDMIGGAVTGFGSAVLTTGLLVIGLQMVGMPDLMNYKPYKIADTGDQLNTVEPLWLSVDSITANFYSSLSAGSLSPGDNALHNMRPDLAVEAAFAHADAYTTSPSRRTIGPASAKIVPEQCFDLTELTPTLKNKGISGDNKQTVVVGTQVFATHADGTIGAADSDSIIRISRQQVALLYTFKDGAATHVTFPIGFAEHNEYVSMTTGEFAYSNGSDVTIAWVFQVPTGAVPRRIRLKSLRLDLPEKPSTEAALADKIMDYVGTAAVDAAPPPLDDKIVVSDRLPFPLDKNQLGATGAAVFNDDAVVSGYGKGKRDIVSSNLALNRINHPDNALIVTVDFGKRGEPKTLFGKIMNLASTVTQPPVLYDTDNKTYFAIGYSVDNAAVLRFRIDHDQPIRSLAQLDLGNIVPGETLKLYYQVPKGATIVRFSLGATSNYDLPKGLLVK